MTEQPPIQPTPVGALRFNIDTARLEYFNGSEYVNITIDSPETNTGGTRGVTNGINENPQWQEHMDFFNIATTGNGQDFGDLSADIFATGSTASSTRGVVFGGYGGSPHSANSDEIQFVTIASQGNAQDFGNLTVGRSYPTTSGNQTRAVMVGGGSPSGNFNTMDYVTIASTGNAVDFGDMTVGRSASCVSGSQTRAVAAGGAKTPGTSNVIDYVTIASTGDAVDFGDVDITYSNSTDGGCGNATRGLFHTRTPNNNGGFFHYNIATTGNAAEFSDKANSGNNTLAGGSNAVRGLFQGGYGTNAISAVTISTFGSAFDFGDMTTTRYLAGAAASGTRYVTIGGATVPSYGMHNTLEYVEIMTTGNFIAFGELVGSDRSQTGGMSNGHGGLG